MTIIEDEAESVEQALEMARAGDLVVVFVDRVDETIEQIKRASKAVEIEQSDAFWCPVPEPSTANQRTRAEAIANTTGLDDEDVLRNLDGQTRPRVAVSVKRET